MSKQARSAPKSAPITAHRLFPAILALWFAALFGIGSFVVPPALLERPVVALHLPSILPAAAPPLGFTARALLSLLLTGTGAAIGLVVGLRLARRAAPAPARRTGPAVRRTAVPAPHSAVPTPRQPLHASEAFAGLDTWGETYTAPASDIPDDGRDAADAWTADAAAHGLALAEPETIALEAAPNADPVTVDVVSPEIDEVDPVFADDDATEAPPIAIAGPGPDLVPDPEPAEPLARLRRGQVLDGDALRAARLDALGTVQLVERLALAMAGWRAPHAAPATLAGPVLEVVPESAPPPEPAPAIVPAAFEPRFAPTDQVPAPPPLPRHFAHDVPDEGTDENAAAEIAGESAADRPLPTDLPRPAILDPIALGSDDWADDGDDDDAAAMTLPRFLSAPVPEPAPPVMETAPLVFRVDPAPASADFDEDDAEPHDGDPVAAATPEDRYPSLLNMAPTTPRTEPIRIEPLGPVDDTAAAGPADFASYAMPFAPPPSSALQSRRPLTRAGFPAPVGGAATLPIAAPELPADPADAEEADRALRAALATLQRMSGSR